MNCLICHNREADKSGSHIIPHLLIASMVNEDASGRDNEQSFRLTTDGSNFFFGRSVLPENLEETLGRSVTDEEIDSSQHHYVVDNIFCSTCEEQLSYLESLYSGEVIGAISGMQELDDSQARISYFFWLSVILRCSVTNFYNFKLDDQDEDSLRLSINNILSASLDSTRENCLNNEPDKNIIVLAHPNANDKSRNFVLLHPDKFQAYLLIINEFIIVYSFNSETNLCELENKLGIELTSKSEETINIGYYNHQEREHIIKYCAGILARQMLDVIKERFKSRYLNNHSESVIQSVLNDFINELINDESIEVTDRYNPKRIEDLMTKYGG